MFNILSVETMIAGGLIPMLGYTVGVTASYLSKVDSDYMKTIATECTISNCLLVLVLVRFCLPQPDADLTSIMPIWVVFTSPAPFILACIVRHIKHGMMRRCQKRREKKYRHFSIVSSLLNVTNELSPSSSSLPISPLPTSPKLTSPKLSSSSPTDCTTIMLVDEKVAVL